jgi:hypothetical protein
MDMLATGESATAVPRNIGDVPRSGNLSAICGGCRSGVS